MRYIRLITALTALIVVSSIGIAQAHLEYHTGHTWESSDGDCVKLYVELSDGNDEHGYVRTTAWTLKRGYTGPWTGDKDCVAAWDREAHQIREETILWKYTESNGWAVCNDFDGGRRNTQTDHMLNFTSYPNTCGDGWYGSTGGAQVYLGEGTWKPIWQEAVYYSGAHWLEG